MTILTLCAVVVTAALFWGKTANAAGELLAGQTTGVAIVNFKRVFDNQTGLTEFKEGMSIIDDQKKESQAKIDELRVQLKKANEDIKNLPDTASLKQRLTQQQQALEIEALLDARARTLSLQLQVQAGDLMRQTFEKVIEASDRLAKKDGWDIILIDDRGVKPPERLKNEDGKEGRRLTVSEVESVIQQRHILSAVKRVDITDNLIEMMNNEFKNPPKTPPAKK
jgi:Skp family chaperone for outer membrane proteins